MTHNEHPFVFDVGNCPEVREFDTRGRSDGDAGDGPVPDVGVIRILSPAPTLYVALRHARLVEAWDGRFARWLAPRRALLHGDAACEIFERQLESAIALREQAFDEQAAQTVSLARVMGQLLTASADLGGHRRVLAGFQRGMHAAPRPWQMLDAVRAELAPWRARLQALEQLLIGRLVENFSCLHGEVELRAGHSDDGGLFVDVVHAMPGATLPPAGTEPEPWLLQGFVEALRGQNARPHLMREIWEIMDRSHVAEANHG